MAILTVSREFGSGGREIGQAVARQLGYEYLDKERILQEIRTFGARWEDWAKDLDEHHPSIWEKYDWSFRGLGALILSTILSYAVKDRVVVMGRGGNWVLKGIPHVLRIRVVAPLDSRVERIMVRESVDRDTARWLAEKTDHDRASFIRNIYGKPWDEGSEFDHLFDTSQQGLDQIIAMVTRLLLERDGQHTVEVQHHLEMLALAAKVKAGLLTDSRLFIPILDVVYEGEGLVLRGVIHNPKEHRRVEEAARKLAGDHVLKCDLHYRK
jgi:cytidylate kinase